MPNEAQSGNVKAPKSRSKTFTGCWTCRARRVKCDEQRPSCSRCRRHGWQCQGYGLRLGWSETLGSRSHRRQIWSSTPQSVSNLSPAAVTALLAELEGCSGDGSAQQRGPFSVFSASNAASEDLDPAPPGALDASCGHPPLQQDGDTASQTISVPLEANLSSGGHGDGEQLSSENATSVSTPVVISSSIPSDAERFSPVPSDPLGNAEDSPMLGTSLADKRPCDSLASNRCQGNALMIGRPSSREDLSFLPTINSLRLPRPETELVHHWVVFLSGNMLLIDTPDNPCRTIFMPLALKGLEAAPEEPNIHVSIFHAICASSAFSLYHLRRDLRYQSLAIYHDQLALRHLRESLQRANRLDEATLAAVLTCITAEAMSGRRSRWRAHVAGGLGLLENEIHGGWIRSPTASRLIQSYLSLSSLCSLPMSTQLMSLLNGPSELRHYLERSHGITTPLVQFLAQITAVVGGSAKIPTGELDRLELQLYLNFPCLSTPDAPGSTIVQHALSSFYYATIIYFRRTLRLVPLSDVQELAEKAVLELEAVESLTPDKGGCAYNWGSFIVAAECQRQDLQTRMLAWFNRKSRHGIQNINILCDIVKALWDRRALAGPDIDIQWQEIAKEADFDIMLV